MAIEAKTNFNIAYLTTNAFRLANTRIGVKHAIEKSAKRCKRGNVFITENVG